MFSTTPEDMLRYAMLFTPSWNKVAKEPIVSDKMMEVYHNTAKPEAYANSSEQGFATDWFGYAPPAHGVQWDVVFDDGAMFKHGNNGQGIYPERPRRTRTRTAATRSRQLRDVPTAQHPHRRSC